MGKPDRVGGEGAGITTAATLPRDDRKFLDDLAAKRGCLLSNVMREAIAEYRERHAAELANT